MADTKISALAALAGANVTSSTDLLAIVDTSAGATKSILVDELAIAVSSSPATWINKSMNVSTNTFNFTPITNSLGGDVALNNTAAYFTGPTVAQGTSGTWFASGCVLLTSGLATDTFYVKLWDGTTVIDSTTVQIAFGGGVVSASLSGYIASPAGNIRISVRDISAATGSIIANNSGNSKDSTLTAIRIA